MLIEPLFTIGHSTRSLEEFIAMLTAHGVNCLWDVRTMPRSRTNPQFNRETLPEALRRHGIAYQHEPRLGGLRRARRDSRNTAWKNANFRGYADYMGTSEFREAASRLLAATEGGRIAVMCAEAVPWRCHRNLIADALVARGADVLHIMSEGTAQPHKLTSFARIEDGDVSYAP